MCDQLWTLVAPKILASGKASKSSRNLVTVQVFDKVWKGYLPVVKKVLMWVNSTCTSIVGNSTTSIDTEDLKSCCWRWYRYFCNQARWLFREEENANWEAHKLLAMRHTFSPRQASRMLETNWAMTTWRVLCNHSIKSQFLGFLYCKLFQYPSHLYSNILGLGAYYIYVEENPRQLNLFSNLQHQSSSSVNPSMQQPHPPIPMPYGYYPSPNPFFPNPMQWPEAIFPQTPANSTMPQRQVRGPIISDWLQYCDRLMPW